MENINILFKDGSSSGPPSSTLTMGNRQSYLKAAADGVENLDGAKDVSGEREGVKSAAGKVRKHKYAFQTRSQVDILDDGYRWRKYGQKIVKNSKFPRSYYKCTYKECNVKKQVQRSSKDDEIVVTTYEGMHTHPVERFTENFEHIIRQMQTYNHS